MSEVRLVIRDAERDRSGTIHGSMADRVVAALSADPQTIEELDAAIDRFAKPDGRSHFGWFHSGIDDEPWDAGLVIVDLAARLVAYESTYSSLGKSGWVSYHDGRSATDNSVGYSLADDWLITSDLLGWRPLAESRRRERASRPPLDVRQVLYGRPLVEHIAAACWRTFLSWPVAAADPATGQPLEEQSAGPAEGWEVLNRSTTEEYAAIRRLHAEWLLAPREDLGGRCPREVLRAGHQHVDRDLESRAQQWSRLDQCPPGLSPESHAFRLAPFGIHEHVLYYELVRELFWSCRGEVARLAPDAERLSLAAGDFLATEVPRLSAARDRWLDGPNDEYHGRTPRSIINRERARLPEAIGAEEAIIDHDCPLCQMMADELHGPTFWHLDGCNMDEDFAFDLQYQTREEWEAVWLKEQREWEEFNRRFEAEQQEKKRLGVEYPGSGYSDPDGVWQRSFVAEDGPEVPLGLRLFAIGARLAELTVDLKGPPEDRAAIDALSRDWGNLREVCQTPDAARGAALIEPVLERFCATLADAAAAHEPLGRKCESLQEQLRRLLEPPQPRREFTDDDIPF
jgi:hypothetical protein